MKRFFILSALLAVTLASMACGGYYRPHYYIFSAYHRNQMGYTFTQRMDRFWQQYTGDRFASAQSLKWVNANEFDQTSNDIITTALQRGDKEMTAYLRLLVEYLNATEQCDPEAWEYPTKQQLTQRSATMTSIYQRAMSYTGLRLRGQHLLLAMRTIMMQADTQRLIEFWRTNAQNAPEGVYKDMMRDIYAGALLRTGKKQEACQIYAELEDMLSIMWIMRDKRNLAGIRDEFNVNPNSPTLTYLVQDYVNNFDWSTEQAGNEWSNIDQSAVIADAQRFVNFAAQAVKNPAVKNPALWQSAAGYITLQLGNVNQAQSMLQQALTMNGTPRMKDNARVCLMLANIADDRQHQSDNYFNRLLPDFRWLKQTAANEPFDATVNYVSYGNHYEEVLSNIVYDELSPRLKRWGKPLMATAMLGWLAYDQRTPQEGSDQTCIGESDSDYANAIDSLSAEQFDQYFRYLKSHPDNGLEAYFIAGAAKKTVNTDNFNDMIGTKYLREGRYADAINYLQKVPLSLISDQGISRYMAKRDFRCERWFKRQVVDRENDWDFGKATVTENQKLTFCREILKRTEAVKRADNPYDKGREQYRLATCLYQASVNGDCWYLTRYFHSAYDTICFTNEYDFTAATVDLLAKAYDNATIAGDFDTQQRALYAAAFIPFGEPYITYTYNDDYKLVPVYHRDTHQYRALKRLANFYQSNRGDVGSYVSRCDVLKQFMAAK